LGDWRSAAAVLFERHSMQGHPEPSRKAGQRPSGTLSARTEGGGGLGTDFECSGGVVATLCVATGQAGAEIGADMAPTLNCNHEAPYISAPAVASTVRGSTHRIDSDCTDTLIAHTLRGEGFDASEDGTGRGTPLVAVQVGVDTYNGSITGDVAATLGTQSGDGVSSGPSVLTSAIAFDSRQDCISSEDHFGSLGASSPQAQAIAFNMHKSGNDASSLGISEDRTDCLRAFEKSPFAVQPQQGMQVRRLTPRECERLQGFPDDYLDITVRGKPAADGPRYKALGNSWAVPNVRWIGERINQVNQIKTTLKAAA
ncbi:MAG: DNA cytosine methyltransferase, partial [Rhodocyclaceae bacterium]|nr:DNA cytosine methyltransferase [Rhodocyclaceae bacterium]